MPINADYRYAQAEKKYLEAKTDEEKLTALEEMLKTAPAHKGSEKFRGDLRAKIKKIKEKLKKDKTKRKTRKGIKKEDMQAVLIGFTNSGKSSLLKVLTNAQPKVADYAFTTINPEIGTMNYENCNIQIIEIPPIGSENFDIGIVNNTDLILVIIEKLEDINPILSYIKKTNYTIVFNKIDLYGEETKRKIHEYLKSKRYDFVMTSTKTKEGIEELKNKIFNSFKIVRVYTKQPGKKEDDVPVIVKPGDSLERVAEKVFHGYSKKVKFAKIWGPSSKFPGQKVGLKHIVKDKDIVEFHTE